MKNNHSKMSNYTWSSVYTAQSTQMGPQRRPIGALTAFGLSSYTSELRK